MEKILSDLVLLRPPLLPGTPPPASVAPEVIESIASKLGRPQINPGAVAFGLPGPVEIVSVRDQLSVDLRPERIRIEDESSHQPFSPHFWDIIAHINELVHEEFKAFGFNFQASIDHEGRPSRDVLAEIFSAPQIANINENVEIGTATIHFPATVGEDEPYMWKIRIEPRFQDSERESTFVAANAHFDKNFDVGFAQKFANEIFAMFSDFSTKIVQEGLTDG